MFCSLIFIKKQGIFYLNTNIKKKKKKSSKQTKKKVQNTKQVLDETQEHAKVSHSCVFFICQYLPFPGLNSRSPFIWGPCLVTTSAIHTHTSNATSHLSIHHGEGLPGARWPQGSGKMCNAEAAGWVLGTTLDVHVAVVPGAVLSFSWSHSSETDLITSGMKQCWCNNTAFRTRAIISNRNQNCVIPDWPVLTQGSFCERGLRLSLLMYIGLDILLLFSNAWW